MAISLIWKTEKHPLKTPITERFSAFFIRIPKNTTLITPLG